MINTFFGVSGYFISIVGNKMFYINFNTSDEYGPGGDLYSCNLDGSGRMLFANAISGQYIIYKNQVYCNQAYASNPQNPNYMDESAVVKYDLNGKKQNVIAKSKYLDDIELFDDHIYYISDEKIGLDGSMTGSIYRMDLDGKNQELILNGPIMQNYIIDDGIIYYNLSYNDNVLYEYNINTHKQSTLKINKIIYNVSDGWVYYSDKNNNLYKIKYDGTSEKLLTKSNINIEVINVTKDWVYYCNLINGSYVNRIRKNGTDFSVLKP